MINARVAQGKSIYKKCCFKKDRKATERYSLLQFVHTYITSFLMFTNVYHKIHVLHYILVHLSAHIITRPLFHDFNTHCKSNLVSTSNCVCAKFKYIPYKIAGIVVKAKNNLCLFHMVALYRNC